MTKTRLYTPEASRFSRTWWTDGLKNFMFVASITLLIWIYADMDVTEEKEFNATIVFTTGHSTDVVLVSQQRIKVDFTLRGTRSGLREFQRFLAEADFIIHYDVAPDSPPGANDVRVGEILRKSANLSQMELVVRSAAPSSVTLVIDKRVSRTAIIELDYTGAKIVGQPVIKPAETTVRLAAIDDTAMPPGPLRLKTRQLDLSATPVGQAYTTQLELVPPATQLPVQLQDTSVEVTVTVGPRTDHETFTVAVQILNPRTFLDDGTWKQYEPVYKDLLELQPQVTVTGARQQLDKLRAEDIQAYITFVEDDKTPVESWLQRKVTIHFPPGIDLQIVGDAPVVNFKLKKINSTNGAAAPPATIPTP